MCFGGSKKGDTTPPKPTPSPTMEYRKNVPEGSGLLTDAARQAQANVTESTTAPFGSELGGGMDPSMKGQM